MTLEWLLILRIQRGFILVFHRDFFALRHPVGGTPFHPHLPFCKDYSHYLLAHVYVYVFVVVLIVLLFLNSVCIVYCHVLYVCIIM